MPAWLSVKPVNTPNAYSGMRAEMLPLKTTIRIPAAMARKMIAVGEHELVAAVGELAGHVAVAGDDRRQPGEALVGGVGGEDQDGERGQLGDPEQERPCRRRCTRPSGRCRSGRPRRGSGWRCDASTDTPMKQTPRMAAMIASVIDALRASGLRNDGTPLETASTPDSATAPDENARSSISRLSAAVPVGQLLGLLGQVLERDRAEVLHEDPVEADDDQQHQHDDVEVRRRGEQRARLPAGRAGWRPSSRRSSAGTSGTRHWLSKPNADWIASTPPATDTATVRM